MADEESWTRLSIRKGKSSYSQERIWLDESIRSSLISKDENLFDYNSVDVYQIEEGFLSINRFRQSIVNVLSKHEIFRTSLEYEFNQHCLEQTINQFNKENYSFEITFIDVYDHQKIDQLIYKEQISKDFDLNQGKIFRCHLLKESEKEKNRLMKNDFILLIFHHSSIDSYSKFLFLKELTFEYENQKLDQDQNQFLRFIDYSFYERKLNLDTFQDFWINLFEDFNFNQRIKLPYDNKLIFISTGSFYSFGIDNSLTRQIFRYKSKSNLNFFRLFLSVFYCYLFKLTQETDLCVLGITPNRYKSQLNYIIGPLQNIIPYRCIIDPHKSFNQTVNQVQQLCTDIKQNSCYPYQNLVAYARKCGSNQYPFSQLSLVVDIDDDKWILDRDNNLILNKISLTNHEEFKRDNKLTPIDLTLNVKCNLSKQTIQFYFDYANKLFEEKTIELLAQRFQKILKHLFDVSSNFDLDEEPIFKLSIILPNEERLIDKLSTNND